MFCLSHFLTTPTTTTKNRKLVYVVVIPLCCFKRVKNDFVVTFCGVPRERPWPVPTARKEVANPVATKTTISSSIAVKTGRFLNTHTQIVFNFAEWRMFVIDDFIFYEQRFLYVELDSNENKKTSLPSGSAKGLKKFCWFLWPPVSDPSHPNPKSYIRPIKAS